MKNIDDKTFPFFSIVRLLVLSLILCTTIFLRQEVLGSETAVKIYALLALSFFISLVTVVHWQDVQRVKFFVPCQILYDILLTSYLIFLTGIDESIFLFLYAVNIIIAAITYQLYGSLIVSGISGVVYAAIYYVNKDTSTQSQFYTLFYNELFFLLTALLSGQFMDAIKKQKFLIDEQNREVSRLRILTNRLINNIPVGVLQIDKNDDVIAVNSTCLELLNLDKLPSTETKYYHLVKELEGARGDWFKLSHEERLTKKFEIIDASGELRLLSLQIVPMPDNDSRKSSVNGDNQRTELILVIQDISKISRLEERLSLESKLAAVGQLAAGIAHEIRTPLAAISGSIETLVKNIETKNPDDQKLIEISLKEIYRLDTLIKDFLNFVKPTKDKIENICVEDTIQEVVTVAKNIKFKNTEVEYKLNFRGRSYISGDVERLKQILLNLVNNAIEAADQPKLLLIISTRIEKNNVRIIVEDNGPGIPEKIRRKIFDPFFTTKKSGTGLGLATVGQIVKTHSGFIQTLPKRDGACFEILFPKVNEKDQQVS